MDFDAPQLAEHDLRLKVVTEGHHGLTMRMTLGQELKEG